MAGFTSYYSTTVNSPTFNPSLDGVYTGIEPPDQYVIDTIDTTPSAIVGGAERGEVNVVTAFSDLASLKVNFGFNTTDQYSISRNAVNFLSTGANNGYGLRISDETDTSAIYIVDDGASGTVLTLTGLSTGAANNIGQIEIAFGYASTIAFPTARLTIRVQYANPEIWDGIVAYTSASGQTLFDMPTLMQNLANAVNLGTAQRGPSQYFIATPGSSTASTFVANSFQASTPGTNGTAGLTSQDLVGQAGDDRSGMWALQGSGVKQYILADNIDPTTAGEQAVFEAQEGCVSVVLLGGPGQTATTAIAAKQAANVSAISQLAAIEWVLVKDPVTGVPTLVPPLGHILGIISTTPSEQSIGQLPSNGFYTILATEHSTAQPWQKSDQDALTAAGIIYPSKQTPGGFCRLPHGQNASCIPGQDQLSYTRLTNELAEFMGMICYPFVDKLQSQKPTDPLRAHLVGSLDSGFGDLMARNRIDNFKVLSDLSNNTPASIAAGRLFVAVWALYLSSARYIMASLQGGTTVNISTSNNLAQLLQAA